MCASASRPTGSKSVASIISRLDTIGHYTSNATFTVSMPQLSDDVVYDLTLLQSPPESGTDPLGCDSYLIDWSLHSESGNPSTGFSAYFNGNHYRYSGERLQEYHMEWDSIPFRPDLIGSRSQGVHRTPQFYALLPQAIAAELRKMQSDSACTITFHPDTLVSGSRVMAIEAITYNNGLVAQEAEYIFDPLTALPRRISIENNPGAISEQSVYVDYSDSRILPTPAPLSDAWLIDRYPVIFALYRESNFSIENLPGQRLPGFAIPTTTGERYSRRTSDSFRVPTIVVLLEAAGGFTPQTVEAVRSAAGQLPFEADIIWAFTDNVADRVEAVIDRPLPGEHLLMSARPLARDCGAASYPVIILTDRNAVVKNVILGYNKDLASDVIQKMALIH